MHGPQALASTTPPMSWSDFIWPSRSIVARTCSDPGVIRNGTADLMPRAIACFATVAARLMSSYDEFVQLPISADEIPIGDAQSGLAHSFASADIGRVRSGECGPVTNGSSADKSSEITRS